MFPRSNFFTVEHNRSEKRNPIILDLEVGKKSKFFFRVTPRVSNPNNSNPRVKEGGKEPVCRFLNQMWEMGPGIHRKQGFLCPKCVSKFGGGAGEK